MISLKRKKGGRGRQGKGSRRERILSRLHAQHGAPRGAQSQDPEIMT